MKTIELKLSNGEIGVVKVDDEDFATLSQYKWHGSRCRTRNYYVARMVVGGSVLMHRQIMGAKKGDIVDHINHDTLDNRRANLRICTIEQNSYNQKPTGVTSKYKGVSRGTNPKRPWQVRIRANGKRIFLGAFASEEDAAEAYREASLRLHGEFSYFASAPEARKISMERVLTGCGVDLREVMG